MGKEENEKKGGFLRFFRRSSESSMGDRKSQDQLSRASSTEAGGRNSKRLSTRIRDSVRNFNWRVFVENLKFWNKIGKQSEEIRPLRFSTTEKYDGDTKRGSRASKKVRKSTETSRESVAPTARNRSASAQQSSGTPRKSAASAASSSRGSIQEGPGTTPQSAASSARSSSESIQQRPGTPRESVASTATSPRRNVPQSRESGVEDDNSTSESVVFLDVPGDLGSTLTSAREGFSESIANQVPLAEEDVSTSDSVEFLEVPRDLDSASTAETEFNAEDTEEEYFSESDYPYSEEFKEEIPLTSESQTGLHSSVQSGDVETVQQFLNDPVNQKSVNTQDSDGKTALHFAVEKGNVAIVNVLLENGANPNIPDNAEFTPMDLAESNDEASKPGVNTYKNMMELMEKKGGKLTLSKSEATSEESPGLPSRQSTESSDNPSEPRSAQEGSYDTYGEISDKDIEENKAALDKLDEEYAAEFPEVPKRQSAEVEEDLPPESPAPQPTEAMKAKRESDMAAKQAQQASRDTQGVELTEEKPVISAATYDATPSEAAIKEQSRPMTEESFNAKNEKGQTPLLIHAESNRAALVKTFLELGADPNAQDNEGNTALHYAAAKGNLVIVNALLEKGADPDIKNNKGENSIDLAVRSGVDLTTSLSSDGSADATKKIDEQEKKYLDIITELQKKSHEHPLEEAKAEVAAEQQKPPMSKLEQKREAEGKSKLPAPPKPPKSISPLAKSMQSQSRQSQEENKDTSKLPNNPSGGMSKR